MGRHETFENAAPIEAELMSGTALGSMLEPDPIYAAIEAHRAAYAEWAGLSEIWNGMTASDPGYAEAEAASDEPARRELAAFEILLAAQPSTIGGAAALANYLIDAVRATRIDAQPSEGERALEAISMALSRLLERKTTAPMRLCHQPTERYDPALAAITAYRAAHAAWSLYLDKVQNIAGGTPEYLRVERAGRPICQAEEGAFLNLLEVEPTTTTGLLALAQFLPEAIELSGYSDSDSYAEIALRNLSRHVIVALTDLPIASAPGS